MTLAEIILASLENINEDTDAETVGEYREGILRAVNEAYLNICANRYLPKKTATVTVPKDGLLAAANLPTDYLRYVEIQTKEGARLASKPEGSGIRVYGFSGKGVLLYMYAPPKLQNDTDEPIIPERHHYCFADYAAYRLLMTGSRTRQARAVTFYENYLRAANRIGEQGKERLLLQNQYAGVRS